MTSDQYVTVRKDGSLHIERVTLDDAGDYTCLAENAVGATNHTTTVNVYGNFSCVLFQISSFKSPWLWMSVKKNPCLSFIYFVISVLPTIQYGPQVFTTIEGTPISLPCRASGVPAPEITWTKVWLNWITRLFMCSFSLSLLLLCALKFLTNI